MDRLKAQLAEVKYAARKQIQNDIYQHEQDLADTGLASTLAVANAGEALRESLQDIDDDIANMQELRSGLLVIGERADTPMLQLFAKNLSEQIVKVEQQLRVFNQRRGNIQRKYDECIEDIKKKEGMVGAWCKERIDQYKNSIKVVAYKVDEVEEELVSVVSEAFDMSKAIGPGEAVKAKLGNEMDPLDRKPYSRSRDACGVETPKPDFEAHPKTPSPPGVRPERHRRSPFSRRIKIPINRKHGSRSTVRISRVTESLEGDTYDSALSPDED